MEQMEDGFGGAWSNMLPGVTEGRPRQGRLLQRKGMEVPGEVPEDD